MATERRNNTRRYRTYGSVAYQPEFEQEPIREPARKERIQGNTVRRQEPRRRPQVRPRRRPAVRPSIQVRPQGAVAPFAVVGLFAVLACALLLVMSCAQLATANNDIVKLRDELANLQDENRTLLAKYELVYDLEAIEKQFLSDGTMIKPGTGQTVYLDLSTEDNVVYYDGAGEGLSGMLQRAERFFAGLLS
ncbi:MAG: hypothetical protein HDT33_08285 [Clostridiales bacterium]|nr:hypothetical protein [Clostridiales bacterium]